MTLWNSDLFMLNMSTWFWANSLVLLKLRLDFCRCQFAQPIITGFAFHTPSTVLLEEIIDDTENVSRLDLRQAPTLNGGLDPASAMSSVNLFPSRDRTRVLH